MNVSHTTAEGRKVTARVVEGTVRDSLDRARIMRAELKQMQEAKDDDGDVKFMVIENLLRLNAFPSCKAATAEYHDSDRADLSIEDMEFDDFLGIPDQFLAKWTAKVFELNPGWSEDNVGPRVRPPSKTEQSKSS